MIHPVCKETCKPYIGQRVCAVLHDGTQVFGVISDVSDRGIEFNGAVKNANVLSKEPKKAKQQLQNLQRKSKTKPGQKAKTAAYGSAPYGEPSGGSYGAPYGGGYGYGGYGGYGAAYALDWAAIALLFLIPFLFI